MARTKIRKLIRKKKALSKRKLRKTKGGGGLGAYFVEDAG
jgi:hypothetical protein